MKTKPGLVLTLFALSSAVLIVFTYFVTSGQETQAAAGTAEVYMLPGTHTTSYYYINFPGTSLVRSIRNYDINGNFLGYVVSAAPTGFIGEIYIMTAFDPSGNIRGLEIVRHTETAGMGAVIEEDWFKEQFVGRSVLLTGVHGASAPHEIDMAAMATVSIEAVLRGVNEAMVYLGFADGANLPAPSDAVSSATPETDDDTSATPETDDDTSATPETDDDTSATPENSG